LHQGLQVAHELRQSQRLIALWHQRDLLIKLCANFIRNFREFLKMRIYRELRTDGLHEGCYLLNVLSDDLDSQRRLLCELLQLSSWVHFD
jgi:hypothetical protein